MIEESQVVAHEADEPDLVSDFLDSDALTGEGLAQVDLLRPEADATTAVTVMVRSWKGYSSSGKPL